MNSEKISNEMELDIDLSNLKKILGKYIYLILIVTFISSLVGYFRARKLPKIWQGQFQIVLNSSNNGSSGDLETSLLSASFRMRFSDRTDLRTNGLAFLMLLVYSGVELSQ